MEVLFLAPPLVAVLRLYLLGTGAYILKGKKKEMMNV